MYFNSYTFMLFFGCVLLLHYAPLSWRLKKFNLLWASYVFYAVWNPPFVVLLWISTIVDWYVSRWLHHFARSRARMLLLLLSLFVNLGLLAFFKYGTFVLDNFVLLVNDLGISYQPAQPNIVLPVGISFYTFQTLSYTLDIYRRRTRPWHSFLDYALYVTFFPQLVAGPIVRSTEFLPQCLKECRATLNQFTWGLSLLVIGLFEKTVIADGMLAPLVEQVYSSSGNPDFLSAWCSTIAFAGQIFCDFAGYSTCAIGVAMCLGFGLPDNFRYPYAAIGFSDFWTRWHISLSSWLRDYLYIPLGGNRKGRPRAYLNLLLTMLIGGLWHGASWTFVVWGGLHGVYLMLEKAIRDLTAHRFSLRNSPLRPLLGLATFGLVCFTWVFFRASTFEQSFSIASAMLGLESVGAERAFDNAEMLIVLLTMTPMLLIHWCLRDTTLEAVASKCPWWLHSALLAVMLFAIATTPGEDRAFIYFQF
jgi:D-alanyl-lipoteichoic acid acyltransferase DltB (MBOAT superfamily)